MAADTTTGPVIVRDYQHAARIFTDSNYRLSPKYGFLFYVEFDFNPNITNVNNASAMEMGMIVKSVNLPKYTIDTKTHNAYNRVNIVQNKIKYEPVTITFHDDQSDTIRSFWYDYYSYFYRDSDYADSTYSAPNKYQSRPTFDWGYTPRPAIGYNNSSMAQPYQYIQGIRIYSLYQQQFSEYQLVNPTITSFKHGDHTQGSDGGLLEHEMSVQFETVKYLSGSVTKNTVGGFIDLHYDTVTSPLAPGTFVPGVNAPDTPTDASKQYVPTTSPGQQPSGGSSPPQSAVAFAGTFNAATVAASRAKTNTGGFSIPSFSSLNGITQGIPTSVQIANQLQAAGVNAVSNATNKLANGVVSGVASALGPNGNAVIGLAAQALSNPSAVLKTAEGMAINYATGMAVNALNSAVDTGVKIASSYAQSAAVDLNNSAGAAVFGDGQSLTQGLSTEFQQLQTNVSDFFTGSGDIASTIGDF
jgi:hypothetical protein